MDELDNVAESSPPVGVAFGSLGGVVDGFVVEAPLAAAAAAAAATAAAIAAADGMNSLLLLSS